MRLRRGRGGDGHDATTTIFFATDVHGSELCFRKFVAAAGFYGADLLVLGGDLTGKLVIPLVERERGGWVAELHGEPVTVSADGAEAFERKIADAGLYAARMTAAERAACDADPGRVDALFLRLMCERLEQWMHYAKARLDGTGVRIVTTPGNDDPPEVDAVIAAHGEDRVLLLEGELFEVAPGHQMLNCGHSNHTPWDTPRELDEDVMCTHVEAMAQRLEEPAGAIFNIHVPPYDSGLDTALALDEELAVKTSMGTQLTAPVGSTAVRRLIEHHQPLASLHGHVHEAGGTARIGRTVAINPGSEYGDGILRGALLTVGGGQLHRFQATSG
jgi:Icc-related predicted phosphoesterase